MQTNQTSQNRIVSPDVEEQMLKTSGNKTSQEDIQKIITWVIQLKDPKQRETSLLELSKMREVFSDLAIYLWYSPGIVATLLQEIINTYKLLAPPSLNMQSSNIACNVLALFQCIAAHPETRQEFINAQIPIFLYPFLNTVNRNKPFEYLRLTALGVIGALVKVDNPDMIQFLLNTEIIPLCLRIMEKGSDLSKTVATFIVQRILLDENGLNYMCNTAERFYAVTSVLHNMTGPTTSPRLLKHIIRSYARLAENPRVQKPLKENLPALFRDKDFTLNLDEASKKWLSTLFKSLSNIHTGNNPNTSSIPTTDPKKFPQSGGNGFSPMSGMQGNNTQNNQLNKGNLFLGYESSIYFNGGDSSSKFMNYGAK